MSIYRIKLKQARCIGCKACEALCKTKNRTPAGLSLGRHLSEGPLDQGGLPRLTFKWQPCFHCEKPECVSVCPSGALTRRETDGLVLLDEETCIGCLACVEACPWAVPRPDVARGKVRKCDLCRDRLEVGLEPACVAGCATHALEFVRREKATSRGASPKT